MKEKRNAHRPFLSAAKYGISAIICRYKFYINLCANHDLMPRTFLTLIALLFVLSSCKKDNLSGYPDIDVKIGTKVRYEVFEEGFSGILAVSYRDKNGVNAFEAVLAPWSYSFQTVTENQPISVSSTASDPTRVVTVRIFIDGKLLREVKGPTALTAFPL